MQSRQLNNELAKALWEKFSAKYQAVENLLCTKLPSELSYIFLDKNDLLSLENALKYGDWTNEIFNHKNLPELALNLQQADKITFQQLSTIIERWQTFSDFPHKQTYKILDENNEFTKEAQNILLPQLNLNSLKPLNEDKLMNLKYLIATLPTSEQIFYTTDLDRSKYDKDSIADVLANSGTGVVMQTDNELIITSSGVFDAIGLARFGIDEYIRPVLRFCAQTIDDVEGAIRKDSRVTAAAFPGTRAFINIHDYPNVTHLEANLHDKYHAILMSTMPKDIVKAILRMVDVVREVSHVRWSKELWNLIDCEMLKSIRVHQSRKDNLSTKEMSQLFCDFIKMGNSELGNYCYLMKNGFSPALMLIFLDMHNHPKKWLELNIDPKYFTSTFKNNYDQIGLIYSSIKDDHPTIQILKFQIFYSLLPDYGDDDEKLMKIFNQLANYINNNKEKILTDTSFKRIIKSDNQPNFINSIYMSYAGQKTIDENRIMLQKNFENDNKMKKSLLSFSHFSEPNHFLSNDNDFIERESTRLRKP